MKNEFENLRDEIDDNKHPEKKPLIADLMVLLFTSVAAFYLLLGFDVSAEPVSALGFVFFGFSLGWSLHVALKLKK